MVSLALIVMFVLVDRRSSVKVLPPSTFGTGPLKWIYLSLAVLSDCQLVTGDRRFEALVSGPLRQHVLPLASLPS